MMQTTTAPYDVAEFLETPEEIAAYLEACIEEAIGDAAFIAKALGDIARAKGMTQIACRQACQGKVSTKLYQGREALVLILS